MRPVLTLHSSDGTSVAGWINFEDGVDGYLGGIILDRK